MNEAERVAAKPRVSLASARLLAQLWPYARQYNKPHQRSEIIADIFDGLYTNKDVQPLIADGLAYKVHNYDPSSFPRHYHSWNPTPLGELAIFGQSVATILKEQERDG